MIIFESKLVAEKEIPEPDFGKYFVGDKCCIFSDPSWAILTVCVGEDVEIISDIPSAGYMSSWLHWLLDTDGLTCWLVGTEEPEDFLKSNGLAPWQEFQVRIDYKYFEGTWNMDPDYDVQVQILSIESMDWKEQAELWKEWKYGSLGT